MNRWLEKMITIVVITIATIAIWWPLQCSFVTLPRLLTAQERLQETLGDEKARVDAQVESELARSCENSESQSISILIALLAQLLALGTKSKSASEEMEDEKMRMKIRDQAFSKGKTEKVIREFNEKQGIRPRMSKEEAFKVIEEYNNQVGVVPIGRSEASRLVRSSQDGEDIHEIISERHQTVSKMTNDDSPDDAVSDSDSSTDHSSEEVIPTRRRKRRTKRVATA